MEMNNTTTTTTPPLSSVCDQPYISSSAQKTAIHEINRARQLLGQLGGFSLPLQIAGSCSSDQVTEIIQEIENCSATALRMLHTTEYCESLDNMKRSKKTIDDKNPYGNKRGRLHEHSRSIVTITPYFDGYYWRKYGRKQIDGAKHMRSYYRCMHSKDQGCPAKKTVQQDDGVDNPPMFTVTYIKQHICKTDDAIKPNVLETATGSSLCNLLSPPSLIVTGNIDQNEHGNLFIDHQISMTPLSGMTEFDGPIHSPIVVGDDWINAFDLETFSAE